MQDALELIDREDEHYVEHELIAPHLLTRTPPGQRYFLKMVGNVVVPGPHIRKICLDHKFQAEYDERCRPKLRAPDN